MIRSWYRSRLFWLGIPGLLFLLWGWGQSNVNRTRFLVRPGWIASSHGRLFWYDVVAGYSLDHQVTYEALVDFREGQVQVIARPGIGVNIVCGVPARRFHPYSLPVKPKEHCWFPPLRWESKRFDASLYYRWVAVPYWMVTGGYATLWLGGLSAWQRRKARFMKALSPP